MTTGGSVITWCDWSLPNERTNAQRRAETSFTHTVRGVHKRIVPHTGRYVPHFKIYNLAKLRWCLLNLWDNDTDSVSEVQVLYPLKAFSFLTSPKSSKWYVSYVFKWGICVSTRGNVLCLRYTTEILTLHARPSPLDSETIPPHMYPPDFQKKVSDGTARCWADKHNRFD